MTASVAFCEHDEDGSQGTARTVMDTLQLDMADVAAILRDAKMRAPRARTCGRGMLSHTFGLRPAR